MLHITQIVGLFSQLTRTAASRLIFSNITRKLQCNPTLFGIHHLLCRQAWLVG